MSSTSTRPAIQVALTLLPLTAAVLMAFLMIGLALPILPLHVHQGLGLSTFVVGLVAGIQFVASLVSRVWAGHYSDSRGPRRAVVTGLLVAALAGLLYLLSTRFLGSPTASVSILLLGRALLGGAESFFITGALSWGLLLVGPQNTGKVIVWLGTAVYAAYALGAPIGTALYEGSGFPAIALATILVPLATLLLILRLRAVAPPLGSRPAFTQVARAVWLPGLGLALCSLGFGSLTTFIPLLFVERAWSTAWLAFSAFSGAFIVARLFFGHLPDKVGGARVAFVSVLIEAAGLALIWFSSAPAPAFCGAALSGFGYSLAFPGFGVEAVRRAPPQSRGLAMGAYVAFLDLGLGLATPALGLVAIGAGLEAVFLVSSLTVLCSAALALRLANR